MISYDDLVAALQAWRARQGLPVAAPTAGSGPRSAPPAPPPPPPRTNPPAPPMARQPMPLASPDDVEPQDELGELNEVEDHAMIEEQHYENEGDDFAMSFAQDGHNGHLTGVNGEDGQETMLGHDPTHEPEPPSDLVDPGEPQRNGRDDW